MAKMTFQQALNQALAQEMERDERVILMGEDIVGGSGSPERWMPGAACLV